MSVVVSQIHSTTKQGALLFDGKGHAVLPSAFPLFLTGVCPVPNLPRGAQPVTKQTGHKIAHLHPLGKQ